MSIWDFFRGKKEKEPEIVEEVNGITRDNLDSFVEEKTKKINEEVETFRKNIKENLNVFISKIEEKIPSLKLINLEERKERENLKKIVLENLASYITHLERLVENMKRLKDKEMDIDDYIRNIQSTFNQFTKNSRNIRERATILIGKELAEVREIMEGFTKSFNSQIKENKNLLEKKKLNEKVDKKLRELEETKSVKKEIENSIKIIKHKISRADEEKEVAEKEYESYTKSKEHLSFIQEQEKIKQENKSLEEDILNLKREIDFKFLLKHFHDDIKKSNILKHYYERFSDSLKEEETELIEILKLADKGFLEEKIRDIKHRILNQRTLGEDKKLKEYESKINRLGQEIIYEKNEELHEESKINKFEEKQKQILIEIMKEAKKL